MTISGMSTTFRPPHCRGGILIFRPLEAQFWCMYYRYSVLVLTTLEAISLKDVSGFNF